MHNYIFFQILIFVLLFSYTKSYEAGGNADLLIPLAGIGLIVLTYVEGIYQIIIRLMAMGA